MTTPRYLSAADWDLYTRNAFGAVEASLRLADLLDAERRVEEFLQRSCVAVATDAEATARPFVPCGSSDVLRIDDCTEISSITIDGATVTPSAYQPEPVRTTSLSGQSRPYEQVRYLLGHWWVTIPGKASVTVTAKWGWPATPSEIAPTVAQIGRLNLLRRQMRIDDDEYTNVLASIAHLRRVEAFGVA